MIGSDDDYRAGIIPFHKRLFVDLTRAMIRETCVRKVAGTIPALMAIAALDGEPDIVRQLHDIAFRLGLDHGE